MAHGIDPALAQHQMRLERQRQLLDQKRKARQLRLHTGMIKSSGIGSRPVSSRPTTSSSSRSRPSTSNTDNINPNDAIDKEEVDSVVTNDESQEGEQLLPATSPVESPSTETQEEAPEETVTSVPLSEKLSAMGLSAAVDYNSDSSSDGDDDNTEIKSPGISPLHEVSVVPEPQTSVSSQLPDDASINKMPLGITLNEDEVENLTEVVFKPPSEDEVVKCRIIRDKHGFDKHMYPIYYLHLELENSRKVFLLASRRRKRSRSSYYIISIDPIDLSRGGENFVAKLRSNFVGTGFTIYDNGEKPPSVETLREELAAIVYETNVLGFKGPRKMNVIIPAMNKDRQRVHVRPTMEPETLLERYKNDEMTHLLKLHNKQPLWSEDTQAYVLNFHGRVTQASVKNFQLVHPSKEDYIVLQFGRISDNTFTLDYRFPMCAVQAFGIALSSFDSKWACE